MTLNGSHTVVWLLKLGPAIALCGLLSACGQKGPLVLPDPAEVEVSQNAEQSEDGQPEGEDDESDGG